MENIAANFRVWFAVLLLIVGGVALVEYNHSGVMTDAGVFQAAEKFRAERNQTEKTKSELAAKAQQTQAEALKAVAEALAAKATPVATPMTLK